MAADLLAMLWNANVEPNGDTYDDAISACEKCKECSIRDMFRRKESHEWKTDYFSVSIIFLAQRKPLGLFLHCARWSSYEFLHSQFQKTEMADLDVPNSWATLASVTHFGILTNWRHLGLSWILSLAIWTHLEVSWSTSEHNSLCPSFAILSHFEIHFEIQNSREAIQQNTLQYLVPCQAILEPLLETTSSQSWITSNNLP